MSHFGDRFFTDSSRVMMTVPVKDKASLLKIFLEVSLQPTEQGATTAADYCHAPLWHQQPYGSVHKDIYLFFYLLWPICETIGYRFKKKKLSILDPFVNRLKIAAVSIPAKRQNL